MNEVSRSARVGTGERVQRDHRQRAAGDDRQVAQRDPRGKQQRAGRERDHERGADVRLGGDEQAGSRRPPTSSGRHSARRSCTRRGLRASSVAEYSTSASFSSSAGSNWKMDGPIQRRAPLTADPHVRDVHRQHQRERHRQQRPHHVLHLRDAVTREVVHQRQPHRPEDHELHEVAAAGAAPFKQRGGRGGGVHHHRAERQQAQRGGQQNAVLERLLARVRLPAHGLLGATRAGAPSVGFGFRVRAARGWWHPSPLRRPGVNASRDGAEAHPRCCTGPAPHDARASLFTYRGSVAPDRPIDRRAALDDL